MKNEGEGIKNKVLS